MISTARERFPWQVVVPVFIVALLASISLLVYRRISALDLAERGLHATRQTTLVVEGYVENYKEWPASWQDLENITLNAGGMFSWPRDSAEIQTLVEIDFAVTIEDLADQKPNEFIAIKPKGETFSSYDLYFDQLLTTIRQLKSLRNGDASN